MEEDKLDAIFRMQLEFATHISSQGRFPTEKIDAIEKLCTAIIHEAVELQRLTNWKWWKQPVNRFDEPAAKEELIDIFHFVIHTALVLGLTPDDFLRVYEQKMQINKKRQAQGY